jgi:transcriptional regulator with XRE-family HTH domain
MARFDAPSIDSHIGQRLKEYRQLRGMTVRELADAAHVTPRQISRYEHGRDRIMLRMRPMRFS